MTSYDKALERARKLKSDYQKQLDKVDKNTQLAGQLRDGISALEMVFPELRESEDERIRKWLLEQLKETRRNEAIPSSVSSVAKAIAWLEKQKEQSEKPTNLQDELKEVTGIIDQPFEDWLDSWYKENKNGEVIIMDEKEFKNWSRGIRNMYEQKPIEIHIDNPNIQKFDPDVKVTTSDSSAGGKELLYVSNKSYNIGFRDGVASVKPAEWSEEDKDYYDTIVRKLEVIG